MIEDGNKSNGKCIQSLNCMETSMIGLIRQSNFANHKFPSHRLRVNNWVQSENGNTFLSEPLILLDLGASLGLVFDFNKFWADRS